MKNIILSVQYDLLNLILLVADIVITGPGRQSLGTPLNRPCHNTITVVFLPVGTEINFIPESWHLIHYITRFNPELDCTLTVVLFN
jgi:hypothetical protein